MSERKANEFSPFDPTLPAFIDTMKILATHRPYSPPPPGGASSGIAPPAAQLDATNRRIDATQANLGAIASQLTILNTSLTKQLQVAFGKIRDQRAIIDRQARELAELQGRVDLLDGDYLDLKRRIGP